MGCDIHLHIEVKVRGKWEHYSHPRIQRNYKLFSYMGESQRKACDKILVEPKGLPDYLSTITLIDYEYDGGEDCNNDVSWLNKEEIKRLCEFMMKEGKRPEQWAGQWEHEELGYANGNAFWSIGDADGGHPKEYEDVRFVFWFDN